MISVIILKAGLVIKNLTKIDEILTRFWPYFGQKSDQNLTLGCKKSDFQDYGQITTNLWKMLQLKYTIKLFSIYLIMSEPNGIVTVPHIEVEGDTPHDDQPHVDLDQLPADGATGSNKWTCVLHNHHLSVII